MRRMGPAEVDAFLGRQALGTVATTRPDGRPHLAPLWYRWDGTHVLIWTDAARRWVRNLRTSPAIAFSAHENVPPFACVVIHGSAEVLTPEAGDGELIEREIRAIAARYVEPDEVEDYVLGWSDIRTLVRIAPKTTTSVDSDRVVLDKRDR